MFVLAPTGSVMAVTALIECRSSSASACPTTPNSAHHICNNSVAVHPGQSYLLPTSSMSRAVGRQDELVTACYHGDFCAAVAAIDSGASVNDTGRAPVHVMSRLTPLAAAANSGHRSLILHLLTLGADPNGPLVMSNAVSSSTADVLGVLIDAGGDVNGRVEGDPRRPRVFQPLSFAALRSGKLLQLLLDQPCWDINAEDAAGRTLQAFAAATGNHGAAKRITRLVRSFCFGREPLTPSHPLRC